MTDSNLPDINDEQYLFKLAFIQIYQKKSLWIYHEAACLLHGEDPDDIPPHDRYRYKHITETAKLIKQFALAENLEIVGCVKPIDAIQWAKKNGYIIPDVLLERYEQETQQPEPTPATAPPEQVPSNQQTTKIVITAEYLAKEFGDPAPLLEVVIPRFFGAKSKRYVYAQYRKGRFAPLKASRKTQKEPYRVDLQSLADLLNRS